MNPALRPDTRDLAGSNPNEMIRRLESLKSKLRDEAETAERDDLVTVLESRTPLETSGPVRVLVVGETKRGKSTLVNTLVGRPLLSPVGVDVTTACWLEIGYGDKDEAEVLFADPMSFGRPRVEPCALREVERYASLTDVTEPVVGVRIRIGNPMLRDLVIVDTPGVGGLVAGHSQITLEAMSRADALLFVCDAKQPILAPEVTFLMRAVERVPTVVVAVTKCDVNPDFEEVLRETRQRIAEHHQLRKALIFPVSPPLADRAADMPDPEMMEVLRQLSGMGPLTQALARSAAAGGAGVRFRNTAAVVGNVARLLLRRADELAHELAGDAEREFFIDAEIERLSGLVADAPRLAALADQRLKALGQEPVEWFRHGVKELERQFRFEAERGSADQLSTLAPRMVAEITATGVAALDRASARSMALMKELLEDIGAVGVIAEIPARDPSSFVVSVVPAEARGRNVVPHVNDAAGVFTALVQLLSGSAAVVAVLSGPGVVAASLALAAGVGWWRIRGDGEQRRRADLGAWVGTCAERSRTDFERELASRVNEAQRYVAGILPVLLATRRRELTGLRAELSRLTHGAEGGRVAALAAQRRVIDRLGRLAEEADLLTAMPLADRAPGAGVPGDFDLVGPCPTPIMQEWER